MDPSFRNPVWAAFRVEGVWLGVVLDSDGSYVGGVVHGAQVT